MIDEYIYVDYENVQDIKVEFIKNTSKVIILIGNEQIKIPIDLVQKLQPMGNLVEWIRVNGKGRNALDFYISFFLGRDVTKDKNKHFVIYSKDTGYDPLITYLKNDGIKIRRIVSFQELRKDSEIKFDEAGINRIKDNLSKKDFLLLNTLLDDRKFVDFIELTRAMLRKEKGKPREERDKMFIFNLENTIFETTEYYKQTLPQDEEDILESYDEL